MPGTPASATNTTSRHSPSSVQATKTRRSIALSAAFNNGPTQVGSEHSAPQSPPMTSYAPHQTITSRVSKGTSVGTMVNPAATASELMSKSPSMKQASDRLPTSLSPVSSLKGGPSTSASSPPAAPSPSISRASGTGSQAKEQASGSMKGGSERSGNSSRTEQEVSYLKSNVGHGVVDLNMRRAAIVQIVFASIAFLLFVGLWIYLIVAAGCFRKPLWDYVMKFFSMSGAICALFVVFHSCFERHVTTRGVFGCIVFFIITIVVFVNIVIGFYAMNCICKCPPNANAYSEGSVSDLTIFGFSLAGALCLTIVLLVASVAHN